jgi:hypothetical integral membrane protein (TIGR02206 family)
VDRFASFSGLHLAAVAGVAAAISLFIGAGYRWRGRARARRLEIGVAAAIVVLRAGVWAWNLMPARLSLAQSLPIQICDLAALCCAAALVGRSRWPAAIAYFWGLALSVQGLLQPDLREGPAALSFWIFWLHHALIVGAALYVVTVRGFRPDRRGLVLAIVAGAAYVAVVFCIDLVLGANYGYLGRGAPSQPTLLDLLGPWPWRVLVIMSLGAVVMVLLYLPWIPHRRSASPSRA